MTRRGLRQAGAVALVALCVLGTCGPLAAAYDTRKFEAALPYEGKLSFTLKKNRAPKITKVQVAWIAADCGKDGTGRFNFTVQGGTPVRDDRTFVVRSEDGTGGKIRIAGELARGFASAEGTVRLRGRFKNSTAGGSAKCDSGKQKFIAE